MKTICISSEIFTVLQGWFPRQGWADGWVKVNAKCVFGDVLYFFKLQLSSPINYKQVSIAECICGRDENEVFHQCTWSNLLYFSHKYGTIRRKINGLSLIWVSECCGKLVRSSSKFSMILLLFGTNWKPAKKKCLTNIWPWTDLSLKLPFVRPCATLITTLLNINQQSLQAMW